MRKVASEVLDNRKPSARLSLVVPDLKTQFQKLPTACLCLYYAPRDSVGFAAYGYHHPDRREFVESHVSQAKGYLGELSGTVRDTQPARDLRDRKRSHGEVHHSEDLGVLNVRRIGIVRHVDHRHRSRAVHLRTFDEVCRHMYRERQDHSEWHMVRGHSGLGHVASNNQISSSLKLPAFPLLTRTFLPPPDGARSWP